MIRETMQVEAGVDWLTGTSADDQAKAEMLLYWEAMLAHEQIPHSFMKKASWQGYAGYRIEHGFFGERQDGVCVIVSGPLAQLHGPAFIDIGARPSRLDLQVTGQPDENVGEAIRHMFSQAKNHIPPNNRPPNLKMWVGRDGPEGLYIGRRTSETMVRIYDKGLESRQKRYKGWLRVEIELKQETARQYAGALLRSDDPEAFCAGAVRACCEARGVTIPFPVGGADVVLRKTSSPTTIESKAAWLRSQVSPTVQAMCEEIGMPGVISLLFPDSLEKHDWRASS